MGSVLLLAVLLVIGNCTISDQDEDAFEDLQGFAPDESFAFTLQPEEQLRLFLQQETSGQILKGIHYAEKEDNLDELELEITVGDKLNSKNVGKKLFVFRQNSTPNSDPICFFYKYKGQNSIKVYLTYSLTQPTVQPAGEKIAQDLTAIKTQFFESEHKISAQSMITQFLLSAVTRQREKWAAKTSKAFIFSWIEILGLALPILLNAHLIKKSLYQGYVQIV